MDDLAPDLTALAAEAHRLDPRGVRVSTRTSPDYRTLLIVRTLGPTTVEVGSLCGALAGFRPSGDLAAEFLLVNTTGVGSAPLDHFMRPSPWEGSWA